MRRQLQNLVESFRFQQFIIGLIIVNAIILGLETWPAAMTHYGGFLTVLDRIILFVFVVELVLRMVAHGFGFFRRPWSLFDLAIVGIALVPTSEAFAALRSLRVLRVLRLVSTISTMRKVVEGLLSAIPGIGVVAAIMMLFFYVFSVLATHLFGPTFPEWFGTLGASMFTLFQIMTLESWSMGIVRPVMDVHPLAWLFFIVFILVTTFTMLNLFIAVIVNAMHKGEDETAQANRVEMQRQLSAEMQDMEKRLLAEMRRLHQQDRS